MSIFTNAFDAASDEAGHYIEAVLDLVGDKNPVAVLEELPTVLREVCEGVGSQELRRSESPGKWSMIEVLAHLADSEIVWAYRLRVVLAEAEPVLTGYDQDRWVDRLRYRERELETVLEDIEFLRGRNIRFLDGLTREELQRSGLHEERGGESVEHMIRLYAGHDLVHRRQLERIRAAVVGS